MWSGPGGSATEHWSWNGTRTEEFDEEAGTLTINFSEAGNFWNLHQPGSGLLLHVKGKSTSSVTFDSPDSPPIDETFTKVGGPDDLAEDGFAALCEAIL